MKVETRGKKAGAAILIPNKVGFKTKAITREKEGPSNSNSGYLPKETQSTTSKGHIHPYVLRSIIYSSQDLKAT